MSYGLSLSLSCFSKNLPTVLDLVSVSVRGFAGLCIHLAFLSLCGLLQLTLRNPEVQVPFGVTLGAAPPPQPPELVS